jgi:type III pantothenate kinase
MNLVIDIGNTLTKIALFQGSEMLAYTSFVGVDAQRVKSFCKTNMLIDNAIISTVKEYPTEIILFLNEHFNTFFFDHNTPVPVINKYGSPETLGKDRLAAVIGAKHWMPNNNILVIDAGTAITYDLVTADGEYLGGAISPGITMRYKALHTFTGRLPLIDYYEDAKLIGNDTASSIQSGVLNGVLVEMEGIIRSYQLIYPDLKIILTGGDHNYFDKRLKIKTFAALNLVLEGLNLILNFNIETP